MANAEDSLASDSTETTSAPSLPLELTAAIIEEAIAIHLDAAEWAKAVELCLLSKTLLPFARGALYRTLYLVESDRGTDPTLGGIEHLGLEEAYRHASANTELLDTLQAAPHLARLVVNMEVRPSRRDCKFQTVQWEISTVLRVCKNVSGISERASPWIYWPAVAEALVEDDNAGRLRDLSVATFYLRDGVDIHALHPASHLKHLSVTEFSDHREVADILPLTPTFHLASFRVDVVDRIDNLPCSLHSFLATSTHSLRRLSVPRSFVSLDLSPFINLEELAILDSLDTDRMLERLPDHIQVVDVRTVPFRLASLIVFLDPATSPSLRRLDAMRFKDEVERRALQVPCWNRGVELYSWEREREEESTSSEGSSSEGED